MLAKYRHTFHQFGDNRSPLIHGKEASNSKNLLFFILILGLLGGFFLAQIFSIVVKSQILDPCKSQEYSKSHFNAHLQNDLKTHIKLYDDNTTLADMLKKEVRILCWIMTSPKNHKARARHVKRTWGKRCNILLFMSSAEDSELPTVKLDVGEASKLKEAFKYVYKHHYNDAEWFYKADDDTYAVVENLRYMLYPYNPETPVHFGFNFKPFVEQGNMSSGAGYVLSREALRKLVVEGIPNPKMCLPGIVFNELLEIGICMEHLNITAGNSLDAMGRSRLFQFIPQHGLISTKNYYKEYSYWSDQFYKIGNGSCCSDLAISWHYMAPELMYVMEYFIYQSNVFGRLRMPEPLPLKLNGGELIPSQGDHGVSLN